MNRSVRILLLCSIVCVWLASASNAKPDDYPLSNHYWMSHAFGEYRIYGSWKAKHEGVDLAAPEGVSVYAMKGGTFYKYEFGKTHAYGNYVVIKHDDGMQTLYAHLSSIKAIANGARIDEGAEIGKSGATGTYVDGAHLHFGVASQQVDVLKSSAHYQTNPLKDILAQPKNATGILDDKIGNAYLETNEGNLKAHPKIILLDANTGEEINAIQSDLSSVSDDGSFQIHPIKIIVEAYQYTNRYYDDKLHKYKYKKTNPHKIKFIITKDGVEVSNNPDEIVFDDMDTPVGNDYRIVEEDSNSKYGSIPFGTKNYYWRYWQPGEAGLYKIRVEVYPIHNDNKGVSYTDDAEREISVGLNLIDYYDDSYGLAYNPDTGASVPSVRAMDITISPTIYYTDISNQIFTQHPEADGFSDHTVFSARTNLLSDWKVNIKDALGNIKDTLDGGRGYETKTKWNGDILSGEYTYEIEAKSVHLGGIRTIEGSSVIIDSEPPGFTDSPAFAPGAKNEITSTEEGTSVVFSPNEDLSSVVVHLYNAKTGEKVVEYLDVSSGIEKDGQMLIDWWDAGTYPNGWYFLQIEMIDLAGNITNRGAIETKIKIDKPWEESAGSEPDIDDDDTPTPATLPLVSDIAFDSAGNEYVLYAKENKLIKYDPSGNKLAEGTSYGGEDFNGPLGLAVSSAGDRVYVADTYNNRVVVFDGKLASIKEIKGQDVYITNGDIITYDWALGIAIINQSNNAGNGIKKYSYEGFSLPEGIAVYQDNLYISDKEKHRLLKYDSNGEAAIFSLLKADLRGEARDAFNRTHHALGIPVAGRTVDKALVYSSALNDKIVFDSKAIDKSRYDRGWLREMFNYSSPSGNANGQFASPSDAIIDSSGNICVLDTGNNRIQKFSPDGAFVSQFGEDVLISPQGIDVDSSGNVWVADTGNHRIVKFNSSGNLIAEYKSDEYEINPHKIVIRGDNLYIADANFEEPLVWNIAGEISEVELSDSWFSPNGDGSGDSINISYNLSHPADVSIQILNSESSIDARAISTDGVTVVNEVLRNAGENVETWNGKIVRNETLRGDGGSDPENQETVADGNYTLKIIASFGDYKKTETFDIHVDTVKPGVALNRDPPGFSPNGDGTNDSLAINYTVSDNASPTAEVTISFLKDDEVLSVIFEEEKSLSVDESLTWDGKVGSWYAEADGFLELKATDLAGNTAVATAELIVDGNPPSAFSILSPSPEAMLFSGRDLTIEWERPEDTNLSSFNVYISTDSSDI
ncbi:MAG: peptidoglycan DD-metalloendopeptidase family protein, partial [Candidatus Margulisbacteria bacterium]|nr:peptidoglycan DD-metalloendopeptidase family protein [Candidatus Margulisiibacteriota bacterium]